MSDSEELDHVNWSASASRLFETCPRQFYYRHQRTESTYNSTEYTPPVRTYLGKVVHECLADQITRWARGENVHLQTATEHATAELEKYVTTNTETIATRFYDDDEDSFDRDSFTRSLTRTAHQHIRKFFRVIWPRFEGHHYITHETRKSFEVCNEPVTVQPDLCTRNPDGEFVVTDWKTSAFERFSDPTIQMQAYALYAHEEYEPELTRIRIQLAHTGTGEFDQMVPTNEDLRHVRERIKADRAFWISEEDVGAYETNPEIQKCKRCSYFYRCTDGQETISEEKE